MMSLRHMTAVHTEEEMKKRRTDFNMMTFVFAVEDDNNEEILPMSSLCLNV